MNAHKNSVKSNLLALLIGLVLAFVLAEVMLRMVTGNIYSDMDVIVDEVPRGIRLTWPMNNSMDATGLYEAGGMVDFQVTEMRNIYPGYENDGKELILFFGGSTTENSMVREGRRFADLIGKALDYYPMNYGKSGNASIESHINLVHLLERYDFRPRIIFLLHGLNDYGIFLKTRSPDGISDVGTLLDARKGSANQEFIKKRFNAYIRKSYVVAHIYIAMKAIFADSYLENLAKDARAQRKLEPLSEEGFQAYIDSSPFRTFLENRKKTYAGFIKAAKDSGARVVLFTQPASYTDSYKSYSGEEVRVFPTTLNGELMSFDQARRMQDLISNNTREAAREGNALLVDLDALFTRQDVSPLIYDTLHYTEQGSKVIADVTVETILRTGFLEDEAWLN